MGNMSPHMQGSNNQLKYKDEIAMGDTTKVANSLRRVAVKPRNFVELIYAWFGFCSLEIWGRMTASMQMALSRIFALVCETRISRFIIRPYSLWQYGDWNHCEKFLPGGGKNKYESFQDFFTREFPEQIEAKSEEVWPCEGTLCESARVKDLGLVNVKGEKRNLRVVFGSAGDDIPDNYYFSNIFLHNKNYHHIHTPVSGRVTRIEHIPGELLWLRPKFYADKPSLPALCNERVNVDIQDKLGQTWFLSIVGGPGVATIRLMLGTFVGAEVNVGQKLGGFLLGSTCCMAGPKRPNTSIDKDVSVAEPL